MVFIDFFCHVFLLIETQLLINFSQEDNVLAQIEEKNLENMEAILTQAAKGIHVLFDNKTIAEVLKVDASQNIASAKSPQSPNSPSDDEFYNFEQIKKVQNLMTELIAKKSYHDKISFLESLDRETYQLVVKAYLHIVENSLKKILPLKH